MKSLLSQNPETFSSSKIDKVGYNLPHLEGCVVSGRSELRWLRLRVMWQLVKVLRERNKSIIKALDSLLKIKKKYQQVFGEPFISKAAKVNGRYFWRLGGPGFPSEACYKMHQNEVNHLLPQNPYSGQRTVFMAITKKCPLNCEHCFEGPNLAKSETVSLKDWIKVVHKFQRFGATQIMFSGGEPMVRVSEIYQLLEQAYDGTDFWIITSGVGLQEKQAKKLKSYGLTGVMVSLDHHQEESHDRFRGYSGAYKAAINAIEACRKSGLATTLSLCATRSFATRLNLDTYMNLARQLGVAFVQLIEPRASGRYSGKDVQLEGHQLKLLEEVYHRYNSHPDYFDYPIINYLGYHQRKAGCFGAGNRFFYIDTDADAHICPFCTGKVINTLNKPAEQVVDALAGSCCHDYNKSII